MSLSKRYTFQESNINNLESPNMNKKGFSSVLLLDIHLKDSENQSINNLNHSFEKISGNNLLPNDLIKQIDYISPNISPTFDELSQLSDLDFETNSNENSLISIDKDDEEFEIYQYNDLSYKTFDNNKSQNKEKKFNHKFSENSYASIKTRNSSYNINPNDDNENNKNERINENTFHNHIYNHHIYNNYAINYNIFPLNIDEKLRKYSFTNFVPLINEKQIIQNNINPLTQNKKDNNNNNNNSNSNSYCYCNNNNYNNINNNNNINLKNKTKKLKKKQKYKLSDEYLIQMFGKKGWICEECNNFNYENRSKCNRCGIIKKAKKIKFNKYQNENSELEEIYKCHKDDWYCEKCNNLNFSFRNFCNKCKMKRKDYNK